MVHLLKYLGQLFHLLLPVVHLDNAPRRQVQTLNRVPTVTDRRANDTCLLGNKHAGIRSLDSYRLVLRDTDANEAATEAQQVHRLSIGTVGGGDYNDGVHTKLFRDRLDGFDHVVLLVVCEKVLGAALHN